MRLLTVAALLIPAIAGTARADVMTYTDASAFFAALGATPYTTEGYDTYPTNTQIPQGGTLNGLTYNFAPTPYAPFGVADPIGRIDTAMGNPNDPNYYPGLSGFGVGTLAAYRPPDTVTSGEDPEMSYFYPGESFAVTFPQSAYAVGIFFAGDPATVQAGDFFIQTAVGTAFNALNPVLGDNALFPTLYFVGLISTTPFDSATFGADINAGSAFNLDNLTYSVNPLVAAIPEPASLAVLCGLLAAGGLVSRRRAARAA